MMLTESGKRISRKWNQKKISGSYTYDGTGLRQSKTVNGVTTNQIWSGGNIVAETDNDGTVFANYYRGIKLFGADINGTDVYYSYNGHGDTTKLIGTNGNVLANYDYDAFGNRTEANGDMYNPFRYCGEYTDDETGLVYLRNRYYESDSGRFITEDPIKYGNNWYVYCGNNPVNFKDPTGLWMEGDELLSQGAQTYTTYYGQQWEKSNKKYLAATTDAERAAAQAEMDNWHNLANDIRTQDAAGTIQGATLNVPVYDQLASGSNLCWATCDAMWISYLLGDTIDRTLDIAIAVASDNVAQGLKFLILMAL